MPDAWNGELVLYAHGFAGFGTEVAVETPPRALRQYMVANGYAWAASSYSENGYVPGIGADDTLALKRHVAEAFGEPERTYIAGASMGGNVVALALENHASEYDGGLALCGALGGIEEIDYLASWVAVAEYTSGLTFPIGEPGADLAPVFLTELPRILGAPDAPTERGRQFASVMKWFTGGPRPFFAEGFREQYIVNFGLVILDPERKLLVNRAATNARPYTSGDGLGVTTGNSMRVSGGMLGPCGAECRGAPGRGTHDGPHQCATADAAQHWRSFVPIAWSRATGRRWKQPARVTCSCSGRSGRRAIASSASRS